MSDFAIENGVLTRYTGKEQNVVIPDGVTSIGEGAFKDCYSLESVVIPEGVTSIGDRAFYKCESLESVVLPKGVTSIGNLTFYNCISLESVVLPKGVTSIGSRAFEGCERLKSVVIPEGVTSIGDSAFEECCSLKSMVLPKGVTSIGYRAFYCCKSLESVVIPESVTSIGNLAFWCCKSLKSVVIPEGVTSINDGAFEDCCSLESVVISGSATSIGRYAFQFCENLTSLNLPKNGIEIGVRAFYGCPKLADEHGFVVVNKVMFGYYGEDKNIVFPQDIEKIDNCAFIGEMDVYPPSDIDWEEVYGLTRIEMNSLTVSPSIVKKLHSKIAPSVCIPVVVKSEKGIGFLVYCSKTKFDNFTDFLKNDNWNAYDIELINNGPTYKYKLPARLLGALGRLCDPVDLTDECKELYVELLVKNAKKLIPIAEELDCPEIIEMMLKHGIINDGNRKAINKLLKASGNEKIAGFGE